MIKIATPHCVGRLNDWLAVWVTRWMSSMWALYIMMGTIMLWCASQAYLGDKAFDPYPYGFLLLLCNLLQLLLMPIIMVGQKIFAGQDEKRAVAEFETTLAIREELRLLRLELAAQRSER
jgi:uncharacterized membrane protein